MTLDSSLGCQVDFCGKPRARRDMCKSHADRFYRKGDARKYNSKTLQFVFFAILRGGQECTLWPFSSDQNGYGQTTLNNKRMRATHATLILSGKPRPTDGHEALHDPIRCSSANCINPNHIRWGTSKENSQDMRLSGTVLRGSRAPNSKLLEEDVLKIRSSGLPKKHLMKKYKIARKTVWRIQTKRGWNHV